MEIKQQTIELHPRVFVPDGAVYSYSDNKAIKYSRQDLTGNRVLFADVKQKFIQGHQYKVTVDAQVIQGAIGLELMLHEIDLEPKPTKGNFSEIVYKTDAAFHLENLNFEVTNFISDATMYIYGSGDCEFIINSIIIEDVTGEAVIDNQIVSNQQNNFDNISHGTYDTSFRINSQTPISLMSWDYQNINDWQFLRDEEFETILPNLENDYLRFYPSIQIEDNVDYAFSFEYNLNGEPISEIFDGGEFSVNFPKDATDPKLTLFVQGNGILNFNQMRVYKDRFGLGYAIAGQNLEKNGTGESQTDLAYYYRPGSKKDKFIVVFSGIQPMNARIEWLGTYTGYDRPLLVFTDSRLFGGAWHLGKRLDPAYQNRIVEIITSIANHNGIDAKDIVTVGYSMGSFGSAYYGALLGAGNIISTLPIYKIGDSTNYDHNVWGGSSWVTQTRQFLLGDDFLNPLETDRLNNLLSDVVDSNTEQLKQNNSRVFIFNEKFDELDGFNFEDNINIWRSNEIPVINSEEYGRHLTHFGTMLEFIKTMLELEIFKDEPIEGEEGH